MTASTSGEQTLYAALELSKNSWLLAIQVPGRDNPSLHPIKGGDVDGLMAKLGSARWRFAKASGQTPKLRLCYEAGYDGFWLARFLEQRGITHSAQSRLMARAMVPVSVRSDADRGAAGNQIALWAVHLPVAERNPHHRLSAVREVTARLDPRRYTIANAPTRMRRLGEDPLAPVLSEEPDLMGALARLSERMG